MSTLKDIAQLANVSTATVSRIINGKGEASPETIKRVKDIVKKLNYQPNSIAKALSVGHSNLIALLVPNLSNTFFSELAEKLEVAANKKGYQIFLCNSQDNREKVRYYLATMRDNNVAGAVINSLYVSSDDLKKLEDDGIATITIDRTKVDDNTSSVSTDNKFGGYIAAKHLLNSNQVSNVLFISGPQQEQSSEDRLTGVQRAIKEKENIKLRVAYGDFSFQSGFEIVDEIFKTNQNKVIDGIISSNDAMALGAIRALADKKINVPNDIKVIGYDNTTAGAFAVPRLTTIEQFDENYFDQIIDELIFAQQHPHRVRKYVFAPKIIARESSK